MERRSVIPVLLVAASALSWTSASGPDTSERFAFSTYREVSGPVTVLVDGYPAALHDEDLYVPVPVAIGFEGLGPNVTVTPESFTLVDDRGTAYPAASYAEILRAYPKLSFDVAVLRHRPIVLGQRFAVSERIPARFFPPPEGGVRTNRVELASFTWLGDVIYFPRPEAGLGGVLALRVEARGIEDPIVVRFVVPRLDH